jgi:hypothetical protein
MLVVACLAVGAVLAVFGQELSQSAPSVALPRELTPNPRYASSAACRECHAEQYASWHRTYHRTMTQVATPETVVGTFDGSEIDCDGLKYRVFERAGELWAEMPDPDVMMDRQTSYERKTARGLPVEPLHWRDLPRVERRVVASTGSHHYQTYWVESAKYPGTLMTLPLVFLIRDQRWIPRESAFLYPPGPRRMVTVWNDHCIKCHSTGPIPAPFAERDPQTRQVVGTGFRSQVGEIGIACEACHGPAQEHIELQRKLTLESDSVTSDAKPADPIVHPGHLADHRRSAQVCGQCHGVYTRNREQALEYRDKGIDYVPGEDLFATRHYIFPPQDDPQFYADETQRLAAIRDYQANPQFFQKLFWENGDMLAGGREFTGLSMSACYIRGQISCVTCHSMHEGDPNDQLIPNLDIDAACQKCHQEPQFNERMAEHTRHAPASAGSSCINCHMPHTTYALFGAIRTHKIDSPDLVASLQHGVPNACNLCHLDKTLSWTADRLADWYGAAPLELAEEERDVAASLLWMLKGHAAQRVIAAWHVGWPPARAASGDDWLAPFMAQLLADPYGAVRYVAASSLRELPGFRELDYDFMAPHESLTGAPEQAVARWRAGQSTPPGRAGTSVLISEDGALDEVRMRQLLLKRDDRPIMVSE